MSDKASDINDSNLQEIINVSSTSALELLKNTEFRSPIWDIYVSGLSYGIYISICDQNFITLDEVADYINNRVLTFLN